MMRRVIVGMVAICGLLLFVGAAFLMIEKSISQDMRDGTRAAIDDQLDQIENSKGRGRMGRLQRRVVEGLRALDRGIFFKSGVDLAAVLPPVPEGWAMRDYNDTDSQSVTGLAYTPSSISQNATQSVLRRFEGARGQGGDAALRVYESDIGLVAVRLELDKSTMRALDRADTGEVATLMRLAPRDRGGKLLMTVDGVDIRGEPRVTQSPDGTMHTADYMHLRFALGQVMRGEVIANAPAHEVLALVQALNMAEVWQALPEAAHPADARAQVRLPQN